MKLELTIKPIGFIRTGKSLKFSASHQPDERYPEVNTLDIISGDKYQKALKDLEGFDRIWLIWWFHRNTEWRPEVLPPRGPSKRRGLFATRSPHRPNPLGISPVQLISVGKGRLILGPSDLIEGTPIFDIKPYIPKYDSFPSAKAGWFDDVETDFASPPEYHIIIDSIAQEHIEWLRTRWRIDFEARMIGILERDPAPHRTRRIRRRHGDKFEIGCGAWYALFKIIGKSVHILNLKPAFPLKFLLDPLRPTIPDKDAQLAFISRWPEFSE